MDELNTTTGIVKEILETDIKARNSDSHLYMRVLEYISEREGFALGCMTVQYFLENMKEYGYPGFETVRRTRQMIQAKRPDLASNEKIAAMRKGREQVFREYARGDV